MEERKRKKSQKVGEKERIYFDEFGTVQKCAKSQILSTAICYRYFSLLIFPLFLFILSSSVICFWETGFSRQVQCYREPEFFFVGWCSMFACTSSLSLPALIPRLLNSQCRPSNSGGLGKSVSFVSHNWHNSLSLPNTVLFPVLLVINWSSFDVEKNTLRKIEKERNEKNEQKKRLL